MLQKPKQRKFKSALDAAMSYLVGMGYIEKDADVVKATGERKGNLSTYKNGGNPSKNFILKFEEYYDIRLSDFDPETYVPRFLIPGKLIEMKDSHDTEAMEEISVSLNKLTSAIGRLSGLRKEQIEAFLPSFPSDKKVFENMRLKDRRKSGGK